MNSFGKNKITVKYEQNFVSYKALGYSSLYEQDFTNIHKLTWIQEMRHLQSIIDYMIMKVNTSKRITVINVKRGPESGSNCVTSCNPMLNKSRSSQINSL